MRLYFLPIIGSADAVPGKPLPMMAISYVMPMMYVMPMPCMMWKLYAVEVLFMMAIVEGMRMSCRMREMKERAIPAGS